MSSKDPCGRNQNPCPDGSPSEQVCGISDAGSTGTANQQLKDEVGARVRTVVDRLFWEMFRTREGDEHE